MARVPAFDPCMKAVDAPAAAGFMFVTTLMGCPAYLV